MEDSYKLGRFISAQGKSIEGAMQELNRGQKLGHWMWYVFPQVKGLGYSPTSMYYAIQSESEAIAYLQNPVLGSRLVACTNAVNKHQDRTAEQIFGYPDYLKFRSSMTLFKKVAGDYSPFADALDRFFGGEPDMQTLTILGSL